MKYNTFILASCTVHVGDQCTCTCIMQSMTVRDIRYVINAEHRYMYILKHGPNWLNKSMVSV